MNWAQAQSDRIKSLALRTEAEVGETVDRRRLHLAKIVFPPRVYCIAHGLVK